MEHTAVADSKLAALDTQAALAEALFALECSPEKPGHPLFH